MIIVSTRFDIMPGKYQEAQQWTEKIWKIIERVGGLGLKTWIITGRTGQVNRITLAAQFASMGDFEEVLDKLGEDAALPALRAEQSNWCTGVERSVGKVIKES